MRVTVIFDDGAVYVAGVARAVAMPESDPNWRAIQWHGSAGDVEQRVGPAFHVADEAVVAPFVAAWEAAAPEEAAEP